MVEAGHTWEFCRCILWNPLACGLNLFFCKKVLGIVLNNPYYYNLRRLNKTIGLSNNRAIPCQRSEEKGQRREVDFFLWNVKDNRAKWWFWPFFEQLLQFGGVFSQKSKIPENDCFEKVKIEKKKKKNLRLKNLFQISYITFL